MMKAKYEKPVLVVEQFVFAQTIAKDCSDMFDDQVTLNDLQNCVWDLGGGTTVFAGGLCSIDGESSGMACYNNPTPQTQIFNS